MTTNEALDHLRDNLPHEPGCHGAMEPGKTYMVVDRLNDCGEPIYCLDTVTEPRPCTCRRAEVLARVEAMEDDGLDRMDGLVNRIRELEKDLLLEREANGIAESVEVERLRKAIERHRDTQSHGHFRCAGAEDERLWKALENTDGR